MTQQTIPDNGERMIPEYHRGFMIYGEHIARYEFVKSLAKNKIVLDIACGSGYGSYLLAQSAKKVVGIDIDEITVNYAQRNYRSKKIEFYQGDAASIPLADKSVDLVVSFETIEHVQNYHQFLSEVKRVLKQNGIFVVSTPNDEQYIEDNPYHIHEFKYGEITKELNNQFKFVAPYFQSTWLYNTLLNESLNKVQWQRPVNTIMALTPKQNNAVYFVMVCSNTKIPDLKPLGSISETWSAREVLAHEKRMAENMRLAEQHINNLSSKVEQLEAELNHFKSSILRRFTKKFTSSKRK